MMRTRLVVSTLFALAAFPVGASESPGNLARNGGFDEALAPWTVITGTCVQDAGAGASKAGSATCASALSEHGLQRVRLSQCVPAQAGTYVFGAGAQRLSGADANCTLAAVANAAADCTAMTDVVTSTLAPGAAGFARSTPQALVMDASTRAVLLDITCVATSSFVVSIDDVTGLPDQIFKHGFEFVSPVITAGAVLNYTENQAASVIDATLTVSDVDSTTLTGATAQITGNYQSGADALAFTPVGAITGNFTVASGTLTLSGTDTLANYQTALRSVTYVNSSDNPSTLVRSITWIANDGVAPPSNSVTSAVNVSAVNDAPVLAGTANLAYTENDAATVLSPALTITDADSTNLTGATVKISANFDAGKDVLSFTPVGGITGNFVSDTLTLSGSSNLANYQTALRSVKYSNTSDNPSALTRSVTWQVDDGAGANNLSNAPVSTIGVTAVNDAPTGVVPAGSPFAITGNVRRGLIAGTLLVGATDPEGSVLTAQLSGVPTNGATVVVNADGSFTYNPGAGYEGAASFQFVVCDAAPLCSAPVTVNVNITGMIWFINAAAAGGGTGRLTDPFNSITTFQASNTGAGNNPAANDNIYLYNGAYTGTMTLLSGQKLFGEGMSITLAAATGLALPPGSDALPITVPANRPSWTSSGTTLTLGSGNTLRGFNIGNSTTAKISGTNFGTLTVNEIALSGAGKALNLTTGAFSGASTFDSIASTSSGTQGISMSGITAGTLTIGGTTISGANTQGILIGTTQANVSFGNTAISAGTDGVSLQNNSAGTRSFGTLSITNGSGVGFLHAVGGGLTTIAGATTITNPAGAGIDIQNSTTAVTFANTSVSKSNAGVAVNLGGASTGNSGAITFANLDLTTSNGAGLVGTENTGTVTVTNGTGTISAAGGPAITVTKAGAPLSPLALNLGNVSSSGSPTQAINLVFTSGTVTATGGTLQTAAGTTFAIGTATANSGGTTAVTYPGTITQATSGQAPIVIQNSTGGTKAFSGAITATAAGVRGISLLTNPGATINFTGGINLSTTTNPAFTATGGGTVSATQNNTSIVNTLTTTTGTALNVASTTIGASGLTFRSITAGTGAGSAGVGINMDATGSSGGLTITGTGVAGSGGTIQHKTGADFSTTAGIGIFLKDTQSIVFNRLQLNDFDNSAIVGRNVNGFTLNDSVINGVIGTSSAPVEGAVMFGLVQGSTENPAGANGLQGTGLIHNTKISGSVEHNLEFYNNTGTMNLTIDGTNPVGATTADCEIKSNSVASGGDGVQMEVRGGTQTLVVRRCLFDDNKSQAVQVGALGNSDTTVTIDLSKILKTSQGNEGFVLSNGADSHLHAFITTNTIGNSVAGTGVGGTTIFVGQVPGNATALSDLRAEITGNTIFHPTSATNHAISALLTSTVGQVANGRVLISGNTVTENSTSGVARAILVDTPDANTTPVFDATVLNNSVSVGDNVAGVVPIVVQSRRTSAPASCANIGSNTATFPNGNPGVMGVRARQAAPGAMSIEQTAACTGTSAAVLACRNPASTTEVLGTVGTVAQGTCKTPAAP